MAIAKKLPSGSWRVLVYSHTEPILDSNKKPVYNNDGKMKVKRIYESFTNDDPSPKGKREAEWQAANFAKEKEKRRNTKIEINLSEALKQYCELKSNVLSPSTLREYTRMTDNYYKNLADKNISNITAIQVQSWVNQFSANHSPKTTRNAFGLIFSTMSMYKCNDAVTDITMPQSKKPTLYTPSDADIQVLLNHVKGTYLETAICLAAFGPMRRGEICALTTNDINGLNLSITKSMVKGSDKKWHIKPPKTESGYRVIEFPQFVIDTALQNAKGEQLVPLVPDSVTKRFIDTIKTLDIPSFRFHDLRHYGASILHAIGIPDQYIIKRGGWATDNVMKSIYRDTISEENKKMNLKIADHFTELHTNLGGEKE